MTLLIAWCNGLGIETFIGSSGRVFPKAMKASPLSASPDGVGPPSGRVQRSRAGGGGPRGGQGQPAPAAQGSLFS